MVRRLALPLLLLVLGAAAAIVPALPGDAQEAPGPPEVDELPLDSQPDAGDDPASPSTETQPGATQTPPETSTPETSAPEATTTPETAPPEVAVLEVGWRRRAVGARR